MSKVYHDEWLRLNPVTGKMEWTRVPPPGLRTSTPQMYQRVRRSKNSQNYGQPAGVRRSANLAAQNMAQQMVRLEKAGVDIVPRLLTRLYDASDVIGTKCNQFTWTADGVDGMFCFNSLYRLANNCPSFTTQAALYKQYRVKQCKIHVMLDSMDAKVLATWKQETPMILAYSWNRGQGYQEGSLKSYQTLSAEPNCVQKVWTINETKPEFWTTITAGTGAGEANWLSTAVMPNTAPNTGMFFAPEFHLTTNSATVVATGGVLTFAYEVEWVVEFSGSKQ